MSTLGFIKVKRLVSYCDHREKTLRMKTILPSLSRTVVRALIDNLTHNYRGRLPAIPVNAGTHEIAESRQLLLITECIQIQTVREVSIDACTTTSQPASMTANVSVCSTKFCAVGLAYCQRKKWLDLCWFRFFWGFQIIMQDGFVAILCLLPSARREISS